jgi:hypothetical protein
MHSSLIWYAKNACIGYKKGAGAVTRERAPPTRLTVSIIGARAASVCFGEPIAGGCNGAGALVVLVHRMRRVLARC